MAEGKAQQRPWTRTADAAGQGRPRWTGRNNLKNIQVIDGADNCVYDVFSATEEEFDFIFPKGTDIAFIDEVVARHKGSDARIKLEDAFNRIWLRRIRKSEAMGIHGVLFYELERKKRYYPSRRDEEATNPNGTRLR